MLETLFRLLPSARDVIESEFYLVPDNIFKAFDLENVDYELVMFCDGDWDLEKVQWDDSDFIESIQFDKVNHSGNLFIWIEANTRFNLPPLQCHSSNLKQFINEFSLCMFFEGDVILLCEESRSLTVVHHEGGYVHVCL